MSIGRLEVPYKKEGLWYQVTSSLELAEESDELTIMLTIFEECLSSKENTCADLLSRFSKRLEQEAVLEVDDKSYRICVLNSQQLEEGPPWSDDDEEKAKLEEEIHAW